MSYEAYLTETFQKSIKFLKKKYPRVLEWYESHKDELMENWKLCRNKETPKPINPLE